MFGFNLKIYRKMENVTLIENESLFGFLKNLQYGSNLVSYKSEGVRDRFLKVVGVVNEIMDGDYIRENQAIDNELIDGYYVEVPIPNVYNVIYSGRGLDIPDISESDINFKETAKSALETKSKIHLQLNEKLRKSAGRIAFGLGIKFGIDSEGCFFDAEQKGVSLSKQIQNAYYNGLEKLDFDARKHNISSIRCYVSALAATVCQKIPVSVSNGIITVRFKQQSRNEFLVSEVEKLYEAIWNELGHDKAREIFESVIFDAEFDKVPEMAPQDLRLSETDLDHTNDVLQVGQNGQMFIKDPNIYDEDDF